MKKPNIEADILHLTLDHLTQLTGWQAQWQPKTNGYAIDGILLLTKGHQQEVFTIETKRVLQPAHLPQLQEWQQTYPNLLVIAGRISPKLMATLREVSINYLESSGNAHIETPSFFLHIEGRKAVPDLGRTHLFTPNSIKLLFHLLVKPELLDEPYRAIAAQTGASLDTISKTLRTLKEQVYLIERSQGRFVFAEKQKLIERWIPEFGERIKPKLLLGRFRLPRHQPWEELPLDPSTTRWSGEPAADKLLKELRPEVFTLYTTAPKTVLAQRYHLLPDPQGFVYVYQAFWDLQLFPELDTAPPLLVYTDLLLTGGGRNLDIAKTLLDAYPEIFT